MDAPARTPPVPLVGADPALGLDGAGLRVRVLGQLGVNGVQGAALGDMHTRFHVRALLALLAASVDGVERDHALEALWPRQPPTAARNRLYHTVHLLRQGLSALAWDGDWVSLAQGRVRLDAQVWTDARCLRLAAQRCADGSLGDGELHRTLQLCGGEWAPGLDLGEPGHQVRGLLHEQHAQLLREDARRRAADGDSPGHRLALGELLRLQPTEEWAYRQLMRLDLDAGRPHAVLKTFDAAARTLAERLGLRPAAATAALAAEASARLQAAGVEVTPGVLTGAAPPRRAAQRLVGREALLTTLATTWARAGGLCNLHGLGGVGKTALAAAAWTRAAQAMPDGAFWVDCGELAPGEPLALACTRALGLAPAPGRTALEQLLHMLRTRRLLLVLDDVDLAPEPAQALAVVAGLAAASQAGDLCATVVLVTRMPTGGPAVQLVPVPGLELPRADMPPSQAAGSASCMLFHMRCPQPPDLADPAVLAEVVRLVCQLDGLPLAIELAAARSVSMTPGEVARQLEQTLQPLDGGPVDLGSRHQSMQAALDWSVQLLSADAALLYTCLSAHTNWFAPGSLPAFLARLQLTLPAPEALLSELLACGLLVRSAHGASMRLLHLPRAHARGRARAAGLWPRLLHAHTAALHTRLLEWPLEYESPRYTQDVQAVAGVHDDALAVLEHAHHHEPGRFVDMAVPLCELWAVRAQVDLGLAWCPRAVEAAQALGMRRQQTRLQMTLARLLNLACQYEAAAEQAQTALALARGFGEPMLVAQAASVLAAMLEPAGRGAEAQTLVADGMRELGLGEGDAGHWTLRARTWQQRVFSSPGAVPASTPVLAPVLVPVPVPDIATLRPRFEGSALWILLLSAACRDADRTRSGAEHAALAHELAQAGRALQSPHCELMGQWELAWCELGRDQIDAAQAAMDACYRIGRAAGLDDRAALAARCMAELHWRRGELDRAERALGLSGELLRHLSDPRGALEMQLHRAMLAALRGQHPAAAQALHAALGQAQGAVLGMRSDVLHLCAEVAAVLAHALRWAGCDTELATLLRQVDWRNDQLPQVQRFRSQWLAHAAPRAGLAQDTAAALYKQLRQRLQALGRERLHAL